jgi:site-specific DNA recombinase
MRATIYARVSSEEQAKADKISLEIQTESAIKEIGKKGWDLISKQYIDPGSTGEDVLPGSAFAQIIEDSAKDMFDIIVVYDYDRWRRDAADSLYYSKQVLKNGVQLYSINQPHEIQEKNKIDRYDDKRMMVQLMGAMKSSMEINSFQRKKKFGIENRVRKGLMPHSLPYGYKIVYKTQEGGRPLKTREINEDEAIIIKRIYHEYTENGQGYRQIARILNDEKLEPRRGNSWTASTIRSVTSNPVYHGEIHFLRTRRRAFGNGTRIPVPESEHIISKGVHVSIISKELFDKAQEIKKKRKKYGGRATGSRHFLSGLLKCKHCGKSMVVTRTWDAKHQFYVCGTWHQGGNCDKNKADKFATEDFVVEKIKSMLNNEHVFQGFCEEAQSFKIEDVKKQIGMVKRDMEKLETSRRKVFELYEDGLIEKSEISKRLDEIGEECKVKEKVLGELEKKINNAKQEKDLRKLFEKSLQEFDQKFEKADVNLKKTLLRGIIEKIVINGSNIDISFLF